MITKSKNNKQVELRKFYAEDFEQLYQYFDACGYETRRRFAPHGYDRKSVLEFHNNTTGLITYIAIALETKKIIAYCLVHEGLFSYDKERLETYSSYWKESNDCTFAPSVADDWQRKGIGQALFNFIKDDLRDKGFKRMVLWGGVQSDHKIALSFYLKNGFQRIGTFVHNNMLNDDMILVL